jgi:hypothetical protein
MVETIAPVVDGGRRFSYWAAIALHIAGAGLAATMLGALLGLLGDAAGAPWGRAGLVAIAVVATIYGVREVTGVPIPIPDRHRQVPEWWRTFFSAPVAALLYGLGLGVGFLTFLSFGTYVAVAVAALASGSPALGALVCAPFGVARALAASVPGLRRGGETAGALNRLEEVGAGSLPRLANAAALAGIAVAALAAL